MNTKKHAINIIFGLLLIAVSATLLLAGCDTKVNIIGLSDYRYDNPENYLVGNAELTEKVENIEIDWMVGNVKVLPHDKDAVSISEKSETELAENVKLRYWLDDTTLRIRFCACGKWNFSDLKKDLTVMVPDTLILGKLKVNSVSADVNLTNCAVSQLVKINTVSGKIKAELTKPLKEFKGDSTSADFTVSAPSVSRLDVDTVSGAVSLSVQKQPDWLEVDSASGSVSLVLPKTASFELDYDTVSGNLYSDLTYRKSAKTYIFGDGISEYDIGTVSGDVHISAND